jgi:hypothetical protein
MTQLNEVKLESEGRSYSHGEDTFDELSELELDIAKVEARLKNARARIRTGPLLIGTLAVLFGMVLAIFGEKILPESFLMDKYRRLLSFATIAYGIFGGFWVYILIGNRVAAAQSELDILNARKRVLNRFAGSPSQAVSQPEVSYFDSLVRINVDNLAAYYALVKVHTDKSFMVSIVVGCIGFILIIAGLILGFIDSVNAKAISYLAAGSGILTEFIAGIFFYLYNRTVRQMKEYHDSLLNVQNILLSFKIVGDTKDEKEKVGMVGQMLAYLIGKPNLPTNIVGSANPKNVEPEEEV